MKKIWHPTAPLVVKRLAAKAAKFFLNFFSVIAEKLSLNKTENFMPPLKRANK